MFFACGLVLMIFILPALAISWVIPSQELSLTAGVMQAFDAFFAYFGLQVLVPIVAIALVCASAGRHADLARGPVEGPAADRRREGYLPPFFQQQNENGIPVNILVAQGGVTTVIALLYALIPTVSSAYWILSVMTTQIYLIIYLLMFVAAVRLRRNQPDLERGYRAPALTFLCVVGFLASARRSSSASSRRRSSRAAARSPTGADPGRHRPDRPAAAVAAPTSCASPTGRRPKSEAASERPRARRARSSPRHRHRTTIARLCCTGSSVPWSSSWSSSGSSPTAGRRRPRRPSRRPQQLAQSSRQAGLPVPQDQDIIVRSLGDDGGAVCENPANALGKAISERPARPTAPTSSAGGRSSSTAASCRARR